MLQKFRVSVFVFFCVSIIALLSFSRKEEASDYTALSTRFSTFTHEFSSSIASLDALARDFKNKKVSLKEIQSKVLQTRLAYKKIEFILAFYHPEYVKSSINGAPLLHIERTGTTPSVFNPEGLQVLDEMVFSEEANEKGNEISYLTTKLKNKYQMLYDRLKRENQLKESLLPAMRIELIRIFSLGITGFDTPGSLNGIAEAAAALESMNGFLSDQKDPNTADALLLFQKTITYLQQPTTFETFDRLTFLKDYLNPLYETLGKLQNNQKINTADLDQISGWNASNTSFFGSDFLNPYHFTELTQEEDSPALKALGKTLFYDSILSDSGTLSCVSCHDPAKSFTDSQPRSISNVQGKTVLRNSPTLLNAVFADRYFYDLRAFTIEQQVEHVIFNSAEFNTSYASILKKLNTKETYKAPIKKAFGTSELDRNQFRKALASYVLSLTSFNSPFDQYMRSERTDLSPKIKEGFNLFMGKANCATCHFAPTFSGLVPPFFNESESEILGVLENPKAKIGKLDTDEGRFSNAIASEKAWIYQKSFKTATVRNSAETAPYFHNGAYDTLEEVIDFYNEGGGEGLGHSVQNQTLSADSLNLTDYEKEALIAFLKSLSETKK